MTGRARTLFVTRRFPPSVGGMQTLAAQVYGALQGAGPTRLIALGRGRLHLIWFLPMAFVRTAWALLTRRVDHVFCGDVVVLGVLWPLLSLRRVRVTVVAHGLDVTYDSGPYAWATRRGLRRADRVIAISRATRDAVLGTGVSDQRVAIVHPGVEAPERTDGDRSAARVRLLGLIGAPEDAFILCTVGRLVARKGVGWFIEEVLASLPEQTVYVVVGDGPERAAVEDTTARTGRGRVHLLGEVGDDIRDTVLLGSDVFVMPNVAVPGDMEGFGLVAVEAAMRGAVVVASKLEGIVDAVADGASGILCEPGDPSGFAETLRALAEEPSAVAARGESFGERARELHSIARFERDLRAAVGA